ncbi:PseG/SpsG family protein [Fusobacterium varium]
MKKINRVIIFTEGGDNIGFGHITRCSALYEEIESRDIEVLFVIFGKNIDDLLKGKRYLNKDWKDREFLKKFLKEDDYIIIDSYLADIETYKFISESTKKCLYIDDNNRISYPKGIILNPVLYDDVVYKTENIVLQGKDYIILRKEFLETTTDTIEKNIDVLITLGGTDIRNLTPKLLQIIKRINSKLKIAVVIGKAFDNIEKIEKEKNDNIEFYYNLNALEMKEIILKSRNIICGCGQSINELLYLKANFFPIVIADNQEKNAAFLYKNKIAGEVLRTDRSFFEIESILRKFMFQKNEVYNLIDGKGIKRIMKFFLI